MLSSASGLGRQMQPLPLSNNGLSSHPLLTHLPASIMSTLTSQPHKIIFDTDVRSTGPRDSLETSSDCLLIAPPGYDFAHTARRGRCHCTTTTPRFPRDSPRGYNCVLWYVVHACNLGQRAHRID